MNSRETRNRYVDTEANNGRFDRGYVLLMCLSPGLELSGYYIDPFNIEAKPTVFSGFKDLMAHITELSDYCEAEDIQGNYVPVVPFWTHQWPKKDKVSRAIYLYHTPKGEWKGNIYDIEHEDEMSFKSDTQMKNLLTLAAEQV